MKPVNLGNRIGDIQWENANEIRSYPFENCLESGDPWRVSKDYDPADSWSIVSDLSIFVQEWRNVNRGDMPVFKLKSVYAGPGLVSMSVSNGMATLSCSVPREEFEPYRPYPMTPVGCEDCFGMCSFGDIPDDATVFHRWDDGPRVLRTLVRFVNARSITSFVDPTSGEEVSGHVVFRVPNGVKVEKVGSTSYYTNIHLVPDGSYDEKVASVCDDPDPKYSGVLPPIYSINGVRPNKAGEIAVILE